MSDHVFLITGASAALPGSVYSALHVDVNEILVRPTAQSG
jgi:hypothetical protein